jgi:NAD-dependent oxidoreductase involved in siderophore biosynthesis
MTIRAAAVFIVLALAPLVPLALTWVRVLNGRDPETSSTTRVRVEIALATLSFVLLMCSLIWTPILGPDYSRRRLGVIYGSLALMVLVAIASASGTKRLKAPLTTSAIILALEWAYLAVVNSVV